MADNNDIGGDAHGFDTIDSNDIGSSGDDSDSGGGGGSREYNGAGSQFNGGGGSGNADLGVFDFCKGEDQPHATAPVPPVDDEPRDAPSIATFSVAEDLRQARHADFVVATNPTTDAVEHSHSASDSLDFGDAGEGGNIHQECNPSIVEPPDQINAPSRAASLSVPPTMITASMPSRLQHTLGLCTIPSPNRPLTPSVANRRGIGHTLLMAPPSTSTHLNPSQFTLYFLFLFSCLISRKIQKSKCGLRWVMVNLNPRQPTSIHFVLFIFVFMLISRQIQKSKYGLRWIEVDLNPP